MLRIGDLLKIFLIVGTFQAYLVHGRHHHNHHHFGRSIIGGLNAQAGEAKFQVQVRQTSVKNYLIFWTREETIGFCGGSLIDANTVVTAAHCVELSDPKIFIKIRYGTQKLSSSEYEDIRVSLIRVHPGYDKAVNDIAILKLSSPVKVGSDSFIQLERSELSTNTQTTIYGWGNYRFFLFQGVQPEDLQKGTLQTLSPTECQTILNGIQSPRFPSDASNRVICARNPQQTACQGDSGGPMVYSNRLVGVTSMVQTGCPKGGLNIYVKVSFYSDWIQQNRN